eukprot:gene12645-biopygen11013
MLLLPLERLALLSAGTSFSSTRLACKHIPAWSVRMSPTHTEHGEKRLGRNAQTHASGVRSSLGVSENGGSWPPQPSLRCDRRPLRVRPARLRVRPARLRVRPARLGPTGAPESATGAPEGATGAP